MGLLSSLKNKPKREFTLAEKLVNFAIEENQTIDYAVGILELNTGVEVSSADIRAAKASLFNIREQERKMRLNDGKWVD